MGPESHCGLNFFNQKSHTYIIIKTKKIFKFFITLPNQSELKNEDKLYDALDLKLL